MNCLSGAGRFRRVSMLNAFYAWRLSATLGPTGP
jgi:hypothetical protein